MVIAKNEICYEISGPADVDVLRRSILKTIRNEKLKITRRGK